MQCYKSCIHYYPGANTHAFCRVIASKNSKFNTILWINNYDLSN